MIIRIDHSTLVVGIIVRAMSVHLRSIFSTGALS